MARVLGSSHHKPRETDLVKSILSRLSLCRDVSAYRVNTGAYKIEERFIRFGLGPGAPDIICVVGPTGHAVALECKVGNNKTTRFQDEWARIFRKSGGDYFVIRTVEEAVDAVSLGRHG